MQQHFQAFHVHAKRLTLASPGAQPDRQPNRQRIMSMRVKRNPSEYYCTHKEEEGDKSMALACGATASSYELKFRQPLDGNSERTT